MPECVKRTDADGLYFVCCIFLACVRLLMKDMESRTSTDDVLKDAIDRTVDSITVNLQALMTHAASTNNKNDAMNILQLLNTLAAETSNALTGIEYSKESDGQSSSSGQPAAVAYSPSDDNISHTEPQQPKIFAPTAQHVSSLAMYPLTALNNPQPGFEFVTKDDIDQFRSQLIDQGVPMQSSSPDIVSEETKSRAQVFTENLMNNQREAVQWLQDNYLYKDTTICRESFFRDYVRFCESHNMVPLSCSGFGKLVRGVFPKVKSRRLGARGQSKYHYYGIGFKGHLGTNGKGGSVCDDFSAAVEQQQAAALAKPVDTFVNMPMPKIKEEPEYSGPFIDPRFDENVYAANAFGTAAHAHVRD